MRLTRRRTLLLLAAAVLLVVAVGPWAAPVLIVASLLLTGRYVGEEIILAARLARLARVVRARWSRSHARALVSLLERAPRSERGPPAPAAA